MSITDDLDCGSQMRGGSPEIVVREPAATCSFCNAHRTIERPRALRGGAHSSGHPNVIQQLYLYQHHPGWVTPLGRCAACPSWASGMGVFEMRSLNYVLLGAGAGLLTVVGAQAADLPIKARPVEYVKVCNSYGACFFYIPGTDTCLQVGGYLRADHTFGGGGHPSAYYLSNA